MSNATNISVDYLIVGQGIAGTLLHFSLKKAGQKVMVIDNHHKGAATKVAAGGINPVTGKRYVKSWKIETLIPIVRTVYLELEKLLKTQFLKERNIIRILKNAGEENTWHGRSADPLYLKYFVENPSIGTFKKYLNEFSSIGEIKNGGQVNISLLVEQYRNLLISNEEISTEAFDFSKLIYLEKEKISYKNIEAKAVIFCEGAGAAHNPYFNYLPFELSKGEAFTIKIEGSFLEKIIRHRVSVVPTQQGEYWVGASNSWEFENDDPTPKAKQELEEHLTSIFKNKPEIVNHQAAIRPTVKDRRPLLGRHPKHPNLFIFNGLGTKGAALAPYFSRQMTNFILKDEDLLEEVDIKRYRHLNKNITESRNV